MSEKDPVVIMKKRFEDVVKFVDNKFGDGYSSKNPDLIKHLIDRTQSIEDRITKS